MRPKGVPSSSMISFLRGEHIVPFVGEVYDVVANGVLIPKMNIAHLMRT